MHAQTDAGQLELTGGQVAVGGKGKAPTLVAQVKPLDAVRWALYYLPVVQLGPAELGDGQGWRAKAKASAEASRKGDLQGALAALDGVAESEVRESRFFSLPRLAAARDGQRGRGDEGSRARAEAVRDRRRRALAAGHRRRRGQPARRRAGGGPQGGRRRLALGHGARRAVLRAAGALRPRRRRREPRERGQDRAGRRARVGAPGRGALRARPPAATRSPRRRRRAASTRTSRARSRSSASRTSPR